MSDVEDEMYVPESEHESRLLMTIKVAKALRKRRPNVSLFRALQLVCYIDVRVGETVEDLMGQLALLIYFQGLYEPRDTRTKEEIEAGCKF